MPSTNAVGQVKHENAEYAAMLGRLIRAYGRRLADSDPYDLEDALALLSGLDGQIADGVRGMRRAGYSWGAIGEGALVTRQAAQQRWGQG